MSAIRHMRHDALFRFSLIFHKDIYAAQHAFCFFFALFSYAAFFDLLSFAIYASRRRRHICAALFTKVYYAATRLCQLLIAIIFEILLVIDTMDIFFFRAATPVFMPPR